LSRSVGIESLLLRIVWSGLGTAGKRTAKANDSSDGSGGAKGAEKLRRRRQEKTARTAAKAVRAVRVFGLQNRNAHIDALLQIIRNDGEIAIVGAGYHESSVDLQFHRVRLAFGQFPDGVG